VRLKPTDANLKIPQIGWNNLEDSSHPVLRGLPANADAYFVHSYHFVCRETDHMASSIRVNNSTVAAVVWKDNLRGTQFHPEKSGPDGLELLGRLLKD